MTAGARAGSVMDTSFFGGDKTVLTEALQLEYTELRHGGGGYCQKPFFPSNEAVGVTAHAAGSGLFQTIQKYGLEAHHNFSTCCGKRQVLSVSVPHKTVKKNKIKKI